MLWVVFLLLGQGQEEEALQHTDILVMERNKRSTRHACGKSVFVSVSVCAAALLSDVTRIMDKADKVDSTSVTSLVLTIWKALSISGPVAL